MNQFNAKLLLALVFAARGTSFLFSKHLLESMSPMSILAFRFIMAFLILCLIFFKKIRQAGKESVLGGLALGGLYTLCMVFEMYGLQYVDTGVSALIENMAILFVPFWVSIVMRRLPKFKTLLCAFLAVIGVGLLSVSQMSKDSGTFGLILIISAAVTYGFCIIGTEKVTRNADPVAIGVFQLGTMGIASLLLSFITGTFECPSTQNQWVMLLILVLLCSCFGFTFQPVGQKYVAAESAAVLTVINPLTASLMGIIAAGESLTPSKLAGYGVILSALVIYNSRLFERHIKI